MGRPPKPGVCKMCGEPTPKSRMRHCNVCEQVVRSIKILDAVCRTKSEQKHIDYVRSKYKRKTKRKSPKLLKPVLKHVIGTEDNG